MGRARRTKAAKWWGGGVVLTATALVLSCDAIIGIEPLSGEHLVGNVSSAGSLSSGGSSSGGSSSGSGGWTPCTESEPVQLMSSDGTLEALDLSLGKNGDVVVVGSLKGKVNSSDSVNSVDQDIFVAKLDNGETPGWLKNFPGSGKNQKATDVAIDNDNDIVFVGYFDGDVTLKNMLTNDGSDDVFVAKLKADGSHVWSNKFGDLMAQFAEGVAVDSEGNIIVVGHFEGEIDFGDLSGIHASSGIRDAFVAKFDSNGAGLWSKISGDGDGDEQRAFGVAVDASNNIFITGEFLGTIGFYCSSPPTASGDVKDLFVVKLDSDGKCLWSKSFGDANGLQSGKDVAVDSKGDILVAGEFNTDAFVVKLSKDKGEHLWSEFIGGEGEQSGASVVSDMDDNVLVTGYMEGDVSFGGTDAFVVRFDSNGVVLCGERFGDEAAQKGIAIASDAVGSAIFATNFLVSPDSEQSNKIQVSKITFTPTP